MHVEPGLGLSQENPARNGNQALMHNEERKGEGETRSGMLRIEARAYRRSKISDDGFRDSVKPERNRGAAKTVLKETNDDAQEKTSRRVAPCKAEANSNAQRKIDVGGH